MKKSLSVLAIMLLSSMIAFAQKQATGTVTLSDEDDDPAVGAYVIVTGTQTGVMTDVDGNFSLEVPAGKTITVTYSGYKSQELPPSSGMNISLQPEATQLEEIEVVNVGYGTMKKSDLTGAISSVKSEQLQRTPASGVDQALQGRAAGVTVNASSGQPGQAAEIRIRGIGSVNSSNDPIYVVDGAIVTNIQFLSPNDIASMEVLKDASATAIYGSRAANGVILITTKKGSKDRPAGISFNAYWGWQNMANTLDVMGRDELVKTIAQMEGNVKKLNALTTGGLSRWLLVKNGKQDYMASNFDYASQETDWQEAIQNKNAFMHNYHLSIDGGGEKYSYALSASYFDQDGTIVGSDYQRLTLRLNTDLQVRKWLKVGENLSFMTSSANRVMNNASSSKANMLSAALAMAPWDPVAYPEGTTSNAGEDISGQYAAATNFTNTTNPFNMIYQSNSKTKTEQWVGDIFMEITPVKGLTIRPSLSMDLANNPSSLFRYKYFTSTNDHFDKNMMSRDYTHYLTLINDNVVTYAREIGKHNFSVMVGESMEQYESNSLSASSTDHILTDERYQYVSRTPLDTTKRGSDGVSRTRRLSFFSRLFYSYDSRYLVTFNMRADASSKFVENHMWGFFPSASLAWRMSGEDWLKHVDNVDNLKLRLGWGQIGNDQIQDDAFVLKVNEAMYWSGYTWGSAQTPTIGSCILTLVNTDGHWETTEQWNAGVDFGFWNKFSGSFDFFCRDTKEMLFTKKLPAQVGNRWDPTVNVGTCRNVGAELTLSHDNKVGDFSYNISLNLSYVKNRIKELNGGEPMYPDFRIIDEGYAINTFYGYDYLGIYKSDAEAAEYLKKTAENDPLALPHEGDAKYRDVNEDGVIDQNDKIALGNPFPALTGGLNFEAAYKGFDLQLFFQGEVGNKLYNQFRSYLEGTGQQQNILSTDMRNVYYYFYGINDEDLTAAGYNWREWRSSEAYIPNPSSSYDNAAASSRFIEDASYLRLKNVTLGYTLPKKVLDKMHLNRLRFYVSGSNLFTLTKYKGYDPEVAGGIDYGNYPQSRTIMFGMNLDF